MNNNMPDSQHPPKENNKGKNKELSKNQRRTILKNSVSHIIKEKKEKLLFPFPQTVCGQDSKKYSLVYNVVPICDH